MHHNATTTSKQFACLPFNTLLYYTMVFDRVVMIPNDGSAKDDKQVLLLPLPFLARLESNAIYIQYTTVQCCVLLYTQAERRLLSKSMLDPWLRSYMLRYPEPWVASVTSYSNFDFYILNFIGKYYQGSFYSYSCVIEVEYKYCNRYVNQKSLTWTPPLVVPTNFSGRDFDSIFFILVNNIFVLFSTCFRGHTHFYMAKYKFVFILFLIIMAYKKFN